LSNEPEVEVPTLAPAQTVAVFFHVACSAILSKSEVVWVSLVTYGVFACFFSGAGAGSRSTLIFGSLGSLTFSVYRTRASTPINIKTIKIWIANFDGQNIDSRTQ
jgi:hypothetical protein